jgi:bidirectional [NiFe] hydrogenase diaphorase subunit
MILTMNGRPVAATPGQTLLDVARANDVEIPTLCHHAGLESHGGCRLCLVELRRSPAEDGDADIVPSCMQAAEDGLHVETDTERVRELRAGVLDLLMAQAPNALLIKELAAEYGLSESSHAARADGDKCILCDICVRACHAVGADAISTAGRGAEGVISLPFVDDSSACVGCGACALSCPTGAIDMTDTRVGRSHQRHIWGRDFERVSCEVTGQPTLTREHAALLAARTGLDEDSFFVSDEGRRRQTADKVGGLLDALAAAGAKTRETDSNDGVSAGMRR